MFEKIVTFLSLLSCLACTTVRYTSAGKIPVYAARSMKMEKDIAPVTIAGESQFYLWGMLPGERQVYVDKEFADRGYVSASYLEIEEYQSFKNLFFTVVSFGMYTPINYRLTAVVRRGEKL